MIRIHGISEGLEAAAVLELREMIPLSRAVDTLVIQVEAGPSRVRDALRHAAEECVDFVEWQASGY